MKKTSIWIDNIKDKELPKLKENITCDILIIGGGIAGLSTAYNLKDTDKKVILIDQSKCGLGVTSNNTGKLTYMQDLIYHKIEKNYNFKVAKLYLDSQKEAIDIITNIIKENILDIVKEVYICIITVDIQEAMAIVAVAVDAVAVLLVMVILHTDMVDMDMATVLLLC